VLPFPALAAALDRASVRCVTIGVVGVNLWARSAHDARLRLFLASHEQALRGLITEDERPGKA
jgi:hypothetical protein